MSLLILLPVKEFGFYKKLYVITKKTSAFFIDYTRGRISIRVFKLLLQLSVPLVVPFGKGCKRACPSLHLSPG
jgi:hypothetical protein